MNANPCSSLPLHAASRASEMQYGERFISQELMQCHGHFFGADSPFAAPARKAFFIARPGMPTGLSMMAISPYGTGHKLP
jgi:hypothetical protein